MKRIKTLLLIIIMTLVLIPGMVKAADTTSSDKVTYTGLNDTLTAEDVATNSDYSENDKDATIYLFRGHGCSHCAEFLTFLSNLSKTDYGTKFKLKAYEVWYNSANNTLMESVAKTLGQDVSGVPFIVIGQKTWSGYTSDYDQDIKDAIDDQYNTAAAQRYDVMNYLTSGTDTGKKASSTKKSYAGDIIAVIIIVVIVAGITWAIVRFRKNEK